MVPEVAVFHTATEWFLRHLKICLEKRTQISCSRRLEVSKMSVCLKCVALTAEVLWSLGADGFPILQQSKPGI